MARASDPLPATPLRPATVLAAVVLLAALLGLTAYHLQHPLRVDVIQPASLHHRIDVNTADAATLQLLPGIGPGIAQHILTHRDRHGPFRRAADLEQVPHIGPRTRARMEPWITLGRE